MLLLLASLVYASDWPSARGPAEGTQTAEGRGEITGLDGGYPLYAWRATYSTSSYNTGDSAVLDTDGDGRPETLGVTRSRVYLWDEDGAVLAVSESMATPYVHGIYDLDGDGLAHELVVVGTGVGGGVFVYDTTSLARLWRSADPGLNGGGALAETAVVDTDGDGIPELLWSTSFTGYADYRLLSFADGFGAPTEVVYALPTTTTGSLPLVSGAWRGEPGGFLVEQGSVLTWFETADRLDEGAQCSADETRCLRLVNQYPDLHASGTIGDRLAFDADGDGDAEYVSASSNDLSAIDIAVVDPSAGLTLDEALLWQLRYGSGGGVPLNRAVYIGDRPNLTSSAGGEAVIATVYGSGTNETDAYGNPADDCVNAPYDYAVVAFSALGGAPVATLVGLRARGVVDTDGDGLAEVITTNDDGTEVAGWELVCDGPGVDGGFRGCDDSGCTFEQAWATPGTLPLVLNQQIAPDAYHADPDTLLAAPDLDGDGAPELLVKDGADLVAWHVDPDGALVELGRHTLDTCSTVGGWAGSGEETWILLEGRGCHEVLDATLSVVSSATLQEYVQGVGLALVGDIGRSVPVVAIGSKIYSDPSTGGGMSAPIEQLTDTPVRFADLDGDGLDELITYRQDGSGDWRVVLYAWTGLAYTERWGVTSAELGGTDRNINVTYAPSSFAMGDFDGDGHGDIALFANDYTRGGTSFPNHGTFFFLDGVDGGLIAAFDGPETGTSATFSSPIQVADLCAGTTCPGTDGVDELVFIGGTSVSWYSVSAGYLLGWSMPTTSEAMWGDFDRDGEPELALGAGFTSTTLYGVSVVELDGTPRWEAVPNSAAGSPYFMHAAGDVDEDGALDVVIGGGYGEVTAHAGEDGALIAGFPVYLSAGLATPERVGPARRVLQVALADIDGDGHLEALVAHDDGFVYALNLAPAEGGPALLWSSYLGSPVQSLRPMDADGDGALEVLVLANDGTARLIDGGDTVVRILEPDDDACTDAPELVLSGTAEDCDAVEIFLQGVSVGRTGVSDGEWSYTTPWPSEGAFRVEVWAVVDDELVASDTLTVSYFDDADGDGVNECAGDCDDDDADRYPGAEEACDGVDADCDGGLSDESDDDGDGYLACEDCDDAAASANPEGEEVCDGLDNNCDGEVDEGDVCAVSSYYRGGGGCGCAAGADAGGSGMLLLAAAALLAARGRRRR